MAAAVGTAALAADVVPRCGIAVAAVKATIADTAAPPASAISARVRHTLLGPPEAILGKALTCKAACPPKGVGSVPRAFSRQNGVDVKPRDAPAGGRVPKPDGPSGGHSPLRN